MRAPPRVDLAGEVFDARGLHLHGRPSAAPCQVCAELGTGRLLIQRDGRTPTSRKNLNRLCGKVGNGKPPLSTLLSFWPHSSGSVPSMRSTTSRCRMDILAICKRVYIH